MNALAFYCADDCDWSDPAQLIVYGMVVLAVIVPIAAIYGLARLSRWLREGDEEQARRDRERGHFS